MDGMSSGDDLAIGIACDRPTPRNRWPEHKHIQVASSPVASMVIGEERCVVGWGGGRLTLVAQGYFSVSGWWVL
jgi:hypothetical protein